MRVDTDDDASGRLDEAGLFEFADLRRLLLAVPRRFEVTGS